MKQVIVIRKDLNMRKGKMVAQGAHASLNAILATAKDKDGELSIPLSTELKSWMEGKYTKITVGVNSEEELRSIYEKAKEKGLLCSFVTDLGLTEFNGQPTATAVAIGPAEDEVVNSITGHLSLL